MNEFNGPVRSDTPDNIPSSAVGVRRRVSFTAPIPPIHKAIRASGSIEFVPDISQDFERINLIGVDPEGDQVNIYIEHI